ncbi:MAG: D-glycerate dehydrogenase [Myxococcales bacterium]|nr:D-glycerate dehydrogenase [Myxococcales bacterium]
MARVLVTRRLPGDGLALLRDHEIVYGSDDDRTLEHGELCAAVKDVDAVICLLTDKMDAAVLEAGRDRLEVVANVAVGVDNIDLAAAERLGIKVCATPGVLDETTADLAFFLILAASRLTSNAESDLRGDRWNGFVIDQFLGRDVHGATLGLVGYGRIAKAVARRAAGFGMQVLHHARRDTGCEGYVAALDELLPRVDVLSLHVPGSRETKHLIDARRLGLMRESAVLVNTARGPVVDEEALAIALEEGRLFAAGLDVYEREPEVHPRLLAAPRTVLLPHIGSATLATRSEMVRLAASGVAQILSGQTPANMVSTRESA